MEFILAAMSLLIILAVSRTKSTRFEKIIDKMFNKYARLILKITWILAMFSFLLGFFILLLSIEITL